jgi:hypothetical protein
MEALKVYTQRILSDLKVCSRTFSDVELIQDGRSLETSSLVLASLSSMLCSAMNPLISANLEEKLKIILPSEVDFEEVQEFFDQLLFKDDHEVSPDFKSLDAFEDTLGCLGISVNTMAPLQVKSSSSSSSGVKHPCAICKKSFNLKKLLTRHIRTFHANNPHTCTVGK